MTATGVAHLLNVLTAPAFQASPTGEVLFVNDAMLKLLGRNADNGRSRTVFGLGLFSNHAEYRGFLRGFKTVGRLQRIRLPSTRLQQPNRQVIMNTLLHEVGEDRSVVGVLTISDPVGAAAALEAGPTEAQVNDLPYFIFSTNGKGRLLSANTATRAFLDVERTASVTSFKMDAIDVDHTEATWQNTLRLAKKNGEATYETNFRRPNGTILPVCVTIVRVEGQPVEKVTVAAHSVSALRRVEGDLRNAHLELDNLRRIRERDQLLLQQDTGELGRNKYTIVSSSPAYQPILRQIEQVAPTDSTVLVTGETGTGKELIARSIHQKSQRGKEPLIIVNCGALPKDLIESELFGHLKGAFTGASRDKVGQFKLADEGTLFLDEIGEMPMGLQTRLLRFLQEGEFTPVGGDRVEYANVRIIAATNRNLAAMVKEGTFRSDLYFRLNVFPIRNIPLRARREDIPLLIDYFITKHTRRLNSSVTSCDPAILPELMRYPFPGNIRELENVVERALILSPGERLTLDWDINAALTEYQLPDSELMSQGASALPTGELGGVQFGNTPDETLSLEEMTRRYIEHVLERTEGKVSGAGGAAELLKMNPQTLFSKIRKLKIER